jgi:hypothetical protein
MGLSKARIPYKTRVQVLFRHEELERYDWNCQCIGEKVTHKKPSTRQGLVFATSLHINEKNEHRVGNSYVHAHRLMRFAGLRLGVSATPISHP